MKRLCLLAAIGISAFALVASGCGDNNDLGQLRDGLGEGDRIEDPEADSDETPAGLDFPSDDEPGDDEPGDDEPGDDEPGDDEPGDDEPGDDEPGDDEPGDDEPDDDEWPTCEAGCGDLGPDCCAEREECAWHDGEDVCTVAEEPPAACEGGCGDLGPDCCAEREECAWHDGEDVCAVAEEPPSCEGDCIGLSGGCCDEREACAWYLGDEGFCASALEPPCHELNEPWCLELADACVWHDGEGACFYADDAPPTCEGDCFTLGWECCGEREACAWYMGDAGFCASSEAAPCHEFNLNWCNEFPEQCEWDELEEACYRRDDTGAVCDGGCWELNGGCCEERADCAWYMGEAGFCASAEEVPCHEFTYEWCLETDGCVWHEGEEACVRSS